MEIKTKYNVGDHVWIMRENKPTKIQISNISVEITGLTMTGTNYLTGEFTARVIYTEIQRKDYGHLGDKDPEYSYYESECFPTKRDLLYNFLSDEEKD